ncbi:MAG: chromosomal replication initiator protein DnaA [Elusimicrobia bacterium]|nr:chromosomal replication initiator protein DnaA [Candidatus Liberimonas magnetica]
MNFRKWELIYFPDNEDKTRWQLRLNIDEFDINSLISNFSYKISNPVSLKFDREFNFLIYFYGLRKNDFKNLTETLRKLCQNGQIIEATSWEDDNNKMKIEKEVDPAVENEKNSQPAHTFAFEAMSLNPSYTFEQFVIGPNNRFTAAAAQAVADNPSRIYNPFFVYGGVGLGKTHLMHAVGHYVKKKNPAARIIYSTTEQFMSDVINALKNNNLNVMREHYRKIDILLMDDIQFLEESESTQEEFFHTFNILHQNGKQIIITSDRPPKQFTSLEDRLRSRFEWGLIADIKSPNLETRVAILKKKGEIEKLELDDNILLYIASKLKSNIRELEGFLKRVNAYASLTHQEVNMDLVKSLMVELLPEEETSKQLETSLQPSKVYVLKSPQIQHQAQNQVQTSPMPSPIPVSNGTDSQIAEKPVLPLSDQDVVLISKSAALPPKAIASKTAKEQEEQDTDLKPVEVAFFYPEGKEKELSKGKERFRDIIKKHKLKFKLEGILERSYLFSEKIDYNFFVSPCKEKDIKIAIIIGPPPETNIEPEDFLNMIASVMDENQISLQLIPWIDINKDYRYLNLSLDITLLKQHS